VSDAPPLITPPSLPDAKKKFQEMARASWLTPIVATVVNVALVTSQIGKSSSPNPVQIVLGPVFVLGGLVLGIVALFGIRKYGSRKILAPALIGIGINIFLIVMAASPLIRLPKRVRLQPEVHLPNSRLLKDERLGFSMDVPEGFREFPEGKRTPTIEHVFIKESTDAGEARKVITVERMNGILSKNQRLTLERIQKHMPAGVTAEVASRNWRGLKVDTIVAAVEQNGMRMVVYTIQIPLIPSAIQLSVTGPESKRAETEQLADGLLASVEVGQIGDNCIGKCRVSKMIRTIQNPWLIPARLKPAAGGAGAERRQKIAHGASRGSAVGEPTSPVGAIRNAFSVHYRFVRLGRSGNPVAPSGAWCVSARCPTADAVGYSLAPLCG
jgi:hypothetical protein